MWLGGWKKNEEKVFKKAKKKKNQKKIVTIKLIHKLEIFITLAGVVYLGLLKDSVMRTPIIYSSVDNIARIEGQQDRAPVGRDIQAYKRHLIQHFLFLHNSEIIYLKYHMCIFFRIHVYIYFTLF